MARQVLLDTNTVSFGDLLSGTSSYQVPSFQRDYSWSEENWDDLWQDIELAIANAEYRHYMGAIVVQPSSRDGRQTVIDGQQRLATLSVLAIVVIRRIHALAEAGKERRRNEERVALLTSEYLGKKDAESLSYSSKLSLNEVDDPVYQDYLINTKEIPPRSKLRKSSRSLLDAFDYFDQKISSRLDLKNGGSLAGFLSKTLATQLLFIRISVQDELNAYTVFETLNARGVELSATDLLKNYLFSLMKSAPDLERVKRQWLTVIDIVKYEHFPDLLRYYLSLTRPLVRKERLFKTLKGEVTRPSSAFRLLTQLRKYAELFVALGDADNEFWSDREDCRQHVKHLILFRVRQLYPLIFAAYDKFDQRQFTRLLRMLAAVSFRYSVVSQRNSNYLERAYNLAANEIEAGRVQKPRAVFEILKTENIYVSDREFMDDFAAHQWATSGGGKKLTRYVLYQLNNELHDDDRGYETDAGTIEHICPENASNAWSAVTADGDWTQNVNRIGNLTLLDRPTNRKLGGKDFKTKRAAYRKCKYGLSSSIKVQDWTVNSIEKRSVDLATHAARIWAVTFD